LLSPEDAPRPATSIPALITRKRLVEFARILLVALIALLLCASDSRSDAPEHREPQAGVGMVP
jgi:hypothetical protein